MRPSAADVGRRLRAPAIRGSSYSHGKRPVGDGAGASGRRIPGYVAEPSRALPGSQAAPAGRCGRAVRGLRPDDRAVAGGGRGPGVPVSGPQPGTRRDDRPVPRLGAGAGRPEDQRPARRDRLARRAARQQRPGARGLLPRAVEPLRAGVRRQPRGAGAAAAARSAGRTRWRRWPAR
ncbi:MAG: hypothetical protein MZV63_18110 [Marinilabiliales bacterium]|nr:hypothetical protein [Marinilabiliales bacterium]